jgi:hypothetical protein
MPAARRAGRNGQHSRRQTVAIAEGISTRLLGRILDSLNIGVVFVDRQNIIQVFSSTAGEMLGEEPAARIGSSVMVCHAEKSAPGVLKRIDDLSSGRVAMTQNWLDYQGRALREYILPVRDAGGEPAGTLLLLHDAAAQVDCLKRLGEWKDVHVSGQGELAPRQPGAGQALAQSAHAADCEPEVRPERVDAHPGPAGDARLGGGEL